MIDQQRLVDYSVECAHVYLGQSMDSKDHFHQAAAKSREVAQSLANRGLNHSLVVLIDDYSRRALRSDLTATVARLRTAGVNPDYVVLESAIATTAQHLLDCIPPRHLKTEGDRTSFLTVHSDINLGNLSRPARRPKALFLERVTGAITKSQQLQDGMISLDRYRDTSVSNIVLAIGDLESRRYGCPLLAACWYLMRLGIEPFTAPIWYERKGARPFAAKRLLTILPKEYLKVEATAVELIGLARTKTISKAARRIEYYFH